MIFFPVLWWFWVGGTNYLSDPHLVGMESVLLGLLLVAVRADVADRPCIQH